MRFRIRFADQIVGALIIIAVLSLAVLLILLGRSQRWFSRDIPYRAWFESALGISPNMDVQYRGFAIGRVKSVRLAENDLVEAKFTIFDTYAGRVTEGSLVELQASPIGLGNRFLFYPGLGTLPLDPDSVIPRRGTPEARELAARNLVSVAESGDDISKLISRAGTILEHLNSIAARLDGALAGTDESAIGRIVGSLERSTAELPGIADSAGGIVAELRRGLVPVLADLQSLSARLADPHGTVASLLDGDGALNRGIDSALGSLTGILDSLERTAEFLPAQLPQVAALIAETRTVLHSVEGLLVALRNNPILKNGFPDEVQTQSAGTSARNLEF